MHISKRALSLLAVISLLVASALPALTANRADAAQLVERSITMSSSKTSQAGVTYAVSFKPTTTSVIRGFSVEFCSNSPLIGDTCTAPTGFNASPTTGTVTLAGGTGDTILDVHASSTAVGRYVVT
ncbi:MAG: hypothetical protein ACR2FM_05860, partial [Candidatus Saccharimonadales bacterium]